MRHQLLKYALSFACLCLTPTLQAAPSFGPAERALDRLAPDAFAAHVQALSQQFASVCGDTFCAGDYSNLQPLTLACSADAAGTQVGQCVWVFAGTYTEVDAASGKVALHSKTYTCDLGLKGSAADLAAFLAAAAQPGPAGDEGLKQAKIPGSSSTLMDVLLKCL